MIATLLFIAFLGMLLAGVPIGAALGLAGAICIGIANSEVQWFGLLAVPQNFYAGLGKYPLLAVPMFVLVGSIFDRSGVALRLGSHLRPMLQEIKRNLRAKRYTQPE